MDWLGSSDRKKNNNSESSGDNVSKQPATLVAGGEATTRSEYVYEKETGVWEEAAAVVNAHEDDVNDIAWFSLSSTKEEEARTSNYFASASDEWHRENLEI